MNDIEPQTLTPHAISTASAQTDLTITLRPASGALPIARVASNSLRSKFTCPCLMRTPKLQLVPTNSAASTEITVQPPAKGRNRTTGTETAYTSGVRVAIASPITSTPIPLDLNSNHTCARVADEV